MIRPMIHNDLPVVMALAALMHFESPRFSQYYFEHDKVKQLLRTAIDNQQDYCALVCTTNDVVVGGFLGTAYSQWFSEDRVAADLALFVQQDKRGGIAAMRLIKAYEAWARDIGVMTISLGVSTGVHHDRTLALYETMGFEEPSVALQKRLT